MVSHPLAHLLIPHLPHHLLPPLLLLPIPLLQQPSLITLAYTNQVDQASLHPTMLSKFGQIKTHQGPHPPHYLSRSLTHDIGEASIPLTIWEESHKD